jgi:hypothetical protein
MLSKANSYCYFTTATCLAWVIPDALQAIPGNPSFSQHLKPQHQPICFIGFTTDTLRATQGNPSLAHYLKPFLAC